jgi:hypothetical protein
MHPRMLDRFSDVPLFQLGHSRRGEHLLQGELDGQEALLVKYSYTIGHGKSRTTHEQLVLILPDLRVAVPAFQLAPETLWLRLLQLLGWSDIDFSGTQESEAFSRNYQLSGLDETAIRNFFSQSLQRYFAENHGWNIQSAAGHLVLSRRPKRSFSDMLTDDRVPRLDDLRELIDGTREIMAFVCPAL